MHPYPGNWVTIGRAVVYQPGLPANIIKELNIGTVRYRTLVPWPGIIGNESLVPTLNTLTLRFRRPTLIDPAHPRPSLTIINLATALSNYGTGGTSMLNPFTL